MNNILIKYRDSKDLGTNGRQDRSGFFIKTGGLSNSKNINPILRLKDAPETEEDGAAPGMIRFNSKEGEYQGYYDTNQWGKLSSGTIGESGKDGINYQTDIEKNNLYNEKDTENKDYCSIFKSITKKITRIDNDNDNENENENENEKKQEKIYNTPCFLYDNKSDNKKFDLSNHNIIFEPNTDNDYIVKVRQNSYWPPCDYTHHQSYTKINGITKLSKILSDNYFYQILNEEFKFYGNKYNRIFIQENGNISFNTGESFFVRNSLKNHFLKARISPLFLDLTPSEEGNSDIFIGYGNHGEYVITYNNYIHNNDVEKFNVYFQVRLFLKDSRQEDMYSDDYFKKGTIQISYYENDSWRGNNINSGISPLVGISNSNLTLENGLPLNFESLYFSSLRNNQSWDESKGKGIPFLKSFFIIEIDNNDLPNLNKKLNLYDIPPLNLNKNYLYKFVLDDLLGDTLNDNIYSSRFEDSSIIEETEKIYYIKTINLGNIKIKKLGIAIRSIYDYEKKENITSTEYYSDSTNNFIGKDTKELIDLTEIYNELIDLTEIYKEDFNIFRDFHTVYKNKSTTSIYNSKIVKIQAKYANVLVNNKDPINKNLIIKIIYCLKTDSDINVYKNNDNEDITILNNNNKQTAATLDYNIVKRNNYGPFHFNGKAQYFKIERDNLENNFEIYIYDYLMTPAEIDNNTLDTIIDKRIKINSNNLTAELLKGDNLELIDISKNTDSKQIKYIEEQRIQLFNILEKKDPGNSQYYLKIYGLYKMGYYGINIVKPDNISSTSQIKSIYNNYKFTKINLKEEFPLSINNKKIGDKDGVYFISNSLYQVVLMTNNDDSEPSISMNLYIYVNNGSLLKKINFSINKLKTEEVASFNFMGDDIGILKNKIHSLQELVLIKKTGNTFADPEYTTISNMRILFKNYKKYIFLRHIATGSHNYKLIFALIDGECIRIIIENNKKYTMENILISEYNVKKLLNVFIFDKNHIFIIVTNNSNTKIFKFKFNDNTIKFEFIKDLEIENEVLFIEKFDYLQQKGIILFNHNNIYLLSFITLDLELLINRPFEFKNKKVRKDQDVNINIISFQVKRDILLILWEEGSAFSKFKSYKIKYQPSTQQAVFFSQLNETKYDINTADNTNKILYVDVHNLNTDDNAYIVILKYKVINSPKSIKIKIEIIKETLDETLGPNILKVYEIESGNKYLENINNNNDEDFSFIFGETRSQQNISNFRILENNEVPLKNTNNDSLFFLGFNNESKLILEGFGKLESIKDSENTEIKITTNIDFNIKNISPLTFGFDGINIKNKKRAKYDLLDINTISFKPFDNVSSATGQYYPLFYSSINTTKLTFTEGDKEIQKIFTGILIGQYFEQNLDMRWIINLNFDIYENNTLYERSAIKINVDEGFFLYGNINLNKILNIVPIKNGFLLFSSTYDVDGYLKIYLDKILVKNTPPSIKFPQLDITAEIEPINNISENFSPIFKFEKYESNNIILSVEYVKKPPYHNTIKKLYVFFIDYGSNPLKVLKEPNLKFIKNIHPVPNGISKELPHQGYIDNNQPPFLSLVNTNSSTLDYSNKKSVVEFKYIENDGGVDNSKYIYIFNWNHLDYLLGDSYPSYNSDDSDNPPTKPHFFHVVRCKQINGKYFESAKSISNQYIDTNIWQGVESPIPSLSKIKENYTCTGFISFFDKNIQYIRNNKLNIYFWGEFEPQYFKINGDTDTPVFFNIDSNNETTMKLVVPDENGTKYTMNTPHYRLIKLEIDINNTTKHIMNYASDTLSDNLNEYRKNPSNFDKIEIETLYLKNANLTNMELIEDIKLNKKYIISSTHGEILGINYPNSHTTTIETFPNREIISFIIYEINDNGNVKILFYGRQQRILSIYIEKGNLILFSPVDDTDNYNYNGKYLKLFKIKMNKLDFSLNNGDGIKIEMKNIQKFNPIIEPSNNDVFDDSTITYPSFFTNLDSGKNFIYDVDNSRYNIILGYNPTLKENPTYTKNDDGLFDSYKLSKKMIYLTLGPLTDNLISIAGNNTSLQTSSNIVSLETKKSHFIIQNGNSNNSIKIIGVRKNTTFDNNDDGVEFISYNIPEIDSDTLIIKTKSLPNYQPRYGPKIIKGKWENETGSKYSIEPKNYGWETLTKKYVNPKVIPNKPIEVNAKSVVIGTRTISEKFWFIGDEGWDSIMVNPEYAESTEKISPSGYYKIDTEISTTNLNNKLLTPIGGIGIATNGVLFYNFSNIQQTEDVVKSGKKDNFGGIVDSEHCYHYHQWPVNLEGMLSLGHPNPSVKVRDLPDLTDKIDNLKFIYGREYYFNQIDPSNKFDAENPDKYNIKFENTNLGKIYRYKIISKDSKPYLYPIDFFDKKIGENNYNMIISNIKPGDTVILDGAIEYDIFLGNVYQHKLTLNNKTYFTFPANSEFQVYNFKNGTGDIIGFITRGDFKYVKVKLSSDLNYFELTDINGNIIESEVNKSPNILNIKTGDIIFFDTTGTDLILGIMTNNDSNSTDIYGFNYFVTSNYKKGLYFIPNNKFNLDNKPLFYNSINSSIQIN